MTTLGTLAGASPLDASDDSRLTFTADAASETLTRALDNTPSDFGNMNSLSWQVEYRQVNYADDTITLGIRIMNGTTVLAAADSGGTFASVSSGITNATDTTSSVTAFAYVNTTATKTDWDGASIELQMTITASMKADGCYAEVDYVAITGDYTVSGGGGGSATYMDIPIQSSGLTDYTTHSISTPDHASFDITGDMDLRFRIELDDYTDAADTRFFMGERYGGNGSQGLTTEEQWFAKYDAFDGRLEGTWRDSVGTQTTENSSSTGWQPTGGTVLDCRFVWDVDNGSGGYTFTSYTREDSGLALTSDSGWTSRGSRVRTAGTTDFQAVASAIYLYAVSSMSPAPTYCHLFRALMYNGVDNTGTLIFDVDFTDASQTSDDGDTWLDNAGRTWTRNGGVTWSGAGGAVTPELALLGVGT